MWCLGEVRFYDEVGVEVPLSGGFANASFPASFVHGPDKAFDGVCSLAVEDGSCVGADVHSCYDRNVNSFCAAHNPSPEQPGWLMFTFPSAVTVKRVRVEVDPNTIQP